MSDELIRQIDKLLDMKVGDTPRLDSILQRLKLGKELYSSDQRYVDSLISVHLFPPESKDDESKNYKQDNFDESVGILRDRLARGEISTVEFDELKKKLEENKPTNIKNEINELNKKMEEMKKANESNIEKMIIRSHKSEGIATVLSILLGFVGILGIGQIYSRKIGIGVGILIIGIVIVVLFAVAAESYNLVATIVFIIIYLILWGWSIVNAGSSCREFNRWCSNPGLEESEKLRKEIKNRDSVWRSDSLEGTLRLCDQYLEKNPNDNDILKLRKKFQEKYDKKRK